MEINRIKYFRTVFEVGSIRRASEILNITPGGLSKSIQVLEDELDEPLFTAQGRNIVPSEFGKKFYSLSADLMNVYEKLQENLNSQESIDTFTIVSWEVFSTYFCSRFAQKYGADFSLRVIERGPNNLEQAILSNQADVGITYAPIPHPDLEYLKVGFIEYHAFTTKDNFKDLTLADIPFAVPITVFPESPTGVKTLDNWPTEINRKISYQFELLETALDVARSGAAAVFCPSFIASMQNEYLISKYQLHLIKHISIPKVKKRVYLVKRKSEPLDDKTKYLLNFLKESLIC